MSYDICLCDPVTKETIEFEADHQVVGGIFRWGGTKEAWLNVTYNYHPHFKTLGEKGIRELYGKTGAESIPILKNVISGLGDNVDQAYWKATEGNAKRALCGLLAFAQMRPDGVWSGD